VLVLTNWSRFTAKAAEILLKGKMKTVGGGEGRRRNGVGSKRRVCEAKLFLPTDRLLLHKTWKSEDKTRVEALGSTVYQRVVLLKPSQIHSSASLLQKS